MSNPKGVRDLIPSPAAAILNQVLGRMDPAIATLDISELLQLFATEPTPPGAANTRWQDELIEQKIPPGAAVLDLGCGDGHLLAGLMQRKHVRGQGVELDSTAVLVCVARGVPVFQSDLDAGLKGFSDGSFDYVILEETLQALHRPTELLQEMLRVGRRGIVSFPNFGYWKVRVDLALRGRMPVTERLPHRWHNTPNIHLLTIQDFLDWSEANGVRIVEGHSLAGGQVRPLQATDNLYAEEALLVVEKT